MAGIENRDWDPSPLGSVASKPEVETQLAGLIKVAELLRGEDMRPDRDAWRDEARRLALAE